MKQTGRNNRNECNETGTSLSQFVKTRGRVLRLEGGREGLGSILRVSISWEVKADKLCCAIYLFMDARW